MEEKNDTIENLDEQIKKLEQSKKENDISLKEEKIEETTKVFKKLEDTDTKIFDSEESITELLDMKDDVENADENTATQSEKEENTKENKVVTEENISKVQNEKVTPKKKNKKSKVIIIILIIVILIVCGISGVFIYKYFKKDDKTVIVDEKELTEEERAEVVKHYGEAIEGIIGVYYSQQTVLLTYEDAVKLVEFDETIKCSTHEVYKDGKVYLNKCSVNGIKTSASYGEKQEEIESSDEILEVYVNNVSLAATLTKPKDTSKYTKYVVHCGSAYSDPVLLADYSDYVFYFDSEYRVQMMNYKTDEKALPNLNYTEVFPIVTVNDAYDTDYVAVNVSGYWGIYNLMDKSQVISPMYSWFSSATILGVGMYNSISAIGNNMLVASDGKNYGIINYTTNKTIIPFEYKQLYKSGNYIWAKDYNDVGYIYDTAGNKYLTEGYDKIYGVVNGIYILVSQEENVKLIQIDGKVLYDYGKIDNIGALNYSLAYNEGPLFQFVDVSNNGDTCIEVLYDPTTKEGSYKEAVCGGMAKPVLYLYPEEETNVTVSFERLEILETTYPKFVGKWQVTADSQGNLTDRLGKKYYALYWDEKRVHEVDFSEGFYVEKDEAIEFLEDKLSYIGLSDYERNEFIMYWLPILEKNEKSLVYFEFTEERESYNKLLISPEPDSLLRLSIHIKKVDKKVSIKKQSLIKFQRKGFVAVEWGGMVY